MHAWRFAGADRGLESMVRSECPVIVMMGYYPELGNENLLTLELCLKWLLLPHVMGSVLVLAVLWLVMMMLVIRVFCGVGVLVSMLSWWCGVGGVVDSS